MVATASTEAVVYRPEADTFDVRASVRRTVDALFGHLLLIAMCCAFTIGLVVAYVMVFPPVYEAEVLLQVEQEDDKIRDSYYQNWNLFRKGELTSEVELFTSPPVVRRVVKELGLSYEEVYHTHLDHVMYLWGRSWIGKQYRKVKKWLFPPTASAYQPTPEEIDFGRTVRGFRKGAALEPIPDTHIGILLVKGPTPRVAEYANRLSETYREERRRVFVEEAEAAYQSLSAEVERAAAERDRVMREQVAFASKNALILGIEKDKLLMGTWHDLDLQIITLQGKVSSLQAQLETVEQLLREEPRMVVNSYTTVASSLREAMRETMFDLRKRLRVARLRFRPGAPELREIEALLAETDSAITAEPERIEQLSTRVLNGSFEALHERKLELTASLAAARADLESKRTSIEVVQARMAELPGLFRRATQLQAEVNLTSNRYGALREKLMMADVSRVTARTAPTSMRVIDQAAPPAKPAWPNTKLLLAGALMLGLLGGIGLAVMVDLLSGRVTRHRLQERSNLPVYATVELRAVPARRLPRLATGARHRAGSALERLQTEPS